jgi:uncharacterized protein YggE
MGVVITTDSSTALLSVRADAHLEVPPDEAVLDYAVSAIADDKAGALRTLKVQLDAATGALRDLGGVVRAAGDAPGPLSWLVRSMRSEPQTRWDGTQQRTLRTGKVIASADLVVAVRDFALLDRIGAAFAGHDGVHVRYVHWSVDHDNPGWQRVRAAAIDAALVKGRDYAAALGGSLLRIEHVADLGLLGDRGGEPEGAFRASAMAAPVAPDDEENGPSLDPVPQDLYAGIEARFTASVRSRT